MVSSDLFDFSDVIYDVFVFFSLFGIKLFYENFLDFKQNDICMVVFGNFISKEVEKQGLIINIKVFVLGIIFMVIVLEKYLEIFNKDF